MTNKFKNQKILVTGGAGFIGSHLVDALVKEGAKVVVIDNLSTGHKGNLNKKVKFYQLDINDPKFEAVFKKEKPEVVYMLAFNTNVPKAVQDPVFDSQSLTGSIKTLDLARRYGIKKVVFSSTSFVYGNTKRLPTPEDEPHRPENPYIISKSTVEQYVQFYGRVHGLNYVIFRYATTYGPRQTGGAMADYIRSINAGRQAEIYGDGKKTRDYMFVGDIVRANLMAAYYQAPQNITPIFNLSTGKETTLYELYKKIGYLLGRPEAEPDFQPDRAGEMFRSRLNNGKVKKYFKWQPEFNLDQGLKITVEHFKKNNSAEKGKKKL